MVDLRFHDLRHEAISRFFELGLNIPEVAVISGHKDPRMLFRYTHLRAEELVGRLYGCIGGAPVSLTIWTSCFSGSSMRSPWDFSVFGKRFLKR